MKYLKKFEMNVGGILQGYEPQLSKRGWSIYNYNLIGSKELVYGRDDINFFLFANDFNKYDKCCLIKIIGLEFDVQLNCNITDYNILSNILRQLVLFLENDEIVKKLEDADILTPSYSGIEDIDDFEKFNKKCSELRKEYDYLWTGEEIGLL